MLPEKWFIRRGLYSIEECKIINSNLNTIFVSLLSHSFYDYTGIVTCDPKVMLNIPALIEDLVQKGYIEIDLEILNLIAIIHEKANRTNREIA